MKAANQTFFLIPGFKDQISNPSYKWLVVFLKDKGFRVIETPVTWAHKTLSKNAAEFADFFNEHKTDENYVLGFSFGAVLAFLTANTLKPQMIFLCSLSPAFKEDANLEVPWQIRYVGKKRLTDLDTYSAKKLAIDLQVPSVIFYGEQEGVDYPKLKTRCEETARLAKNSKLIVVKDAPHKINFPAYQTAIKEALTVVIGL
jgi:pimeloyl-ACP methyl ester carboxylesterase